MKCLLDIPYLQLPSGVYPSWVTALRADSALWKDHKAQGYSIEGKCQALLSPSTMPVREGLFLNTRYKPALARIIVFVYVVTMGEGFRQVFLLHRLFMTAYSNKADER